MGRTSLRCRCGQRIGQREVMHAGYYPRMFGPSVVLVRFRCSRCKKMDQKYVRQEEWDDGILSDSPTEASTVESQRFSALGPIDLNEQAEFHRALETLTTLPALKPTTDDGDDAP